MKEKETITGFCVVPLDKRPPKSFKTIEEAARYSHANKEGEMVKWEIEAAEYAMRKAEREIFLESLNHKDEC